MKFPKVDISQSSLFGRILLIGDRDDRFLKETKYHFTMHGFDIASCCDFISAAMQIEEAIQLSSEAPIFDLVICAGIIPGGLGSQLVELYDGFFRIHRLVGCGFYEQSLEHWKEVLENYPNTIVIKSDLFEYDQKFEQILQFALNGNEDALPRPSSPIPSVREQIETARQLRHQREEMRRNKIRRKKEKPPQKQNTLVFESPNIDD